ncbi:E3 SUMO-protein ligase ZBED1-like [Corythoichthys intestinalis]|uniref:E3 SUMO-protein ligase ZBED1-like n=1 Tax=Corythoichthys intestinalis TaxID=161448 RepID=UPI0025A4EB8A|nr:E3 SUMO-protein ligase ZBED1-like [Corythoichthys intestinalis]
MRVPSKPEKKSAKRASRHVLITLVATPKASEGTLLRPKPHETGFLRHRQHIVSPVIRNEMAHRDDNELTVDKKAVEEALINMIIVDCQPFSFVEDTGFRKLIQAFDPTYVLPTRQTLKAMVEERYQQAKEKAQELVAKSSAVSITADMWTSINTDAYLAVTGHFIDEHTSLHSAVLGVLHFPDRHTAENMAAVKSALMAQWGISTKVTCLVTDGAANMAACAKDLHLRHTICVAHTLNLIVKKALAENTELSEICLQCRRIVGYFKSSTTAKTRLTQVQEQMKPTEHVLKLIQEVETRWNSTFHMLQRMYYLKEAVGAALAGLHTDITPLTSHQLRLISESLQVLSPFNDATVELSEEKRVSGSKVIPLLAMLHHTLEDDMGAIQMEESKAMAEGLKKQLRDKLYNLQAMSVMSLATLLDPRFKKIGFFSPNKAQEAERRLTAECAAVIRHRASSSLSSSNPSSSTQPDTSEGSQPVEQGDKLWRRLDHTVMQRRTQSRTQSESADATVEVHTYLGEPNTSRKSNPLDYWEQHKHIYPNLYKLAITLLCTPASSVPCERVFSKAGEILSKKRNRLKPKTLEMLIFLNKNE